MVAVSGSPPGSGLEDESIRGWAEDVAHATPSGSNETTPPALISNETTPSAPIEASTNGSWGISEANRTSARLGSAFHSRYSPYDRTDRSYASSFSQPGPRRYYKHLRNVDCKDNYQHLKYR